MPRKRRLNDTAETTDTAGTTAAMPPPPDGSSERVTLESLAETSGIAETAAGLAEREGMQTGDDEMDPIQQRMIDDSTGQGPLAYTVDDGGNVGNVERDATPAQPSTNGKPKRIQISLVRGRAFNPQKCKFCGKKCPPHPARLAFRRPLGTTATDLCSSCCEVFTVFLEMIGEGEVALEIVGPGGHAQTNMLDQLEQAVDGDDDGEDGDQADDAVEAGDVDGPPTEEVAERIRRIAAELPGKPHDQGGAAFCEGIAVDDNPYGSETGPLNADRRKQWDAGWIAAKVGAMRAAGDDDEAAQLEEAAKVDVQAAVQAMADEMGAEVTVRALRLDGSEIHKVEATPA